MILTHVVIDSSDGEVFKRDGDGNLFNAATAAKWVVERHALTEDEAYQTYAVFVVMTEDQRQALIDEHYARGLDDGMHDEAGHR